MRQAKEAVWLEWLLIIFQASAFIIFWIQEFPHPLLGPHHPTAEGTKTFLLLLPLKNMVWWDSDGSRDEVSSGPWSRGNKKSCGLKLNWGSAGGYAAVVTMSRLLPSGQERTTLLCQRRAFLNAHSSRFKRVCSNIAKWVITLAEKRRQGKQSVVVSRKCTLNLCGR